MEEKVEVKRRGVRYSAVKILNRHERSGSYIDKLIASEIVANDYSPEDKALLTEIVYGVVRWKLKLDWVLTGFFHGDYNKCLNFVKNALRVGLYQLLMLDKIPAYAAIDESVEIVKNLQGDKATGLVNGVLRNISRNLSNIRYPDETQDYFYKLAVVHSHPKWLAKRWVNRLGEEQAIKLFDAFNTRPDMALRVNTLKASVKEITDIFDEKSISYQVSPICPESIILKTSNINVPQTELFKQGKISIQDVSATLASKLANVKEGNRVLDMCAAPGGKSTAMAEFSNDKAKITANDLYDVKLPLIEENVERLGLKSITTISVDAKTMQMKDKFDIVFLDAPCSGIGTIRKHPEIKWSIEYDNLLPLAKLQKILLENAATLVKNGGALIYSTCTITPEENEDNVAWFLDKFPDFKLDPAEKYLPSEVCVNGMMCTRPDLHSADGAFAVRLIKKAT